MKKILCIGDSLALPREGCDYEDTWFFLLKTMYPRNEFIPFFERGLRITKVDQMFDVYYNYYKPDIVIIQCGVCDCSPRIINDLSLHWRIIIKLVGFCKLESIFWRIIKRLFRRKAECVYTNPDQFCKCYKSIVDRFILSSVERIVIVKIGHSSDSILKSSPSFNNNVDAYNKIIDEAFGQEEKVIIVNPLDRVYDNFFLDGYHCSPKGMNIVYNTLVNLKIF